MTVDSTRLAEWITRHRTECEVAIASAGLANQSAWKREIAAIRRSTDPLFEQMVRAVAALQFKANRKLTPARSENRVWWVTEKSLQQATPWQVSNLKSQWLDNETVYDLCCGIGGDAVAFATQRSVVAVDVDPVVAAMAEANLTTPIYLTSIASLDGDALNGMPTANASHSDSAPGCKPENVTSTRTRRVDAVVRCISVEHVDLPPGVSVHIDPDRRANHTRTSNPSQYQPSWNSVSTLAERSRSCMIKLAPAAELPDGGIAEHDVHRCWISLQGSVREQTVLWGDVVDQNGLSRGTRSAIVVRADGSHRAFTLQHPELGEHPDRAKAPLAWIIDPSSAIRAAGLTESFAIQHSLQLLGGPSGFLTADSVRVDASGLAPLATIGRVLWTGSSDDRKLRKELRNRGVYPETIKVRGTDHDPTKLHKRYRQCGEQPITLWIGRADQRVFAAITESC